MAGQTTAGPITPAAVVAVNGWADLHFGYWRMRQGGEGKSIYTNVTVHNFSIMPREMCFELHERHDKDIQRPVNARGEQQGRRVFSSANGFPSSFADDEVIASGGDAALNTKRVARSLRPCISFVGVALTRIDASNTNQSGGLSMQVAGMTSIKNTGPYRITGGRLVAWDFPGFNGKDRGVMLYPDVPDKRLFCTVPLSAMLDPGQGGYVNPLSTRADLLHELLDPLGPQDGSARTPSAQAFKRRRRRLQWDEEDLSAMYEDLKNATGEDFKARLANFVVALDTVAYSHTRRIIGIALSSADEGQQFEILLRAGGSF